MVAETGEKGNLAENPSRPLGPSLGPRSRLDLGSGTKQKIFSECLGRSEFRSEVLRSEV